MADDDLTRFRTHTGRVVPNPDGYKEFWAVAGRRSGKSFVLALVAVFLAAFRDWRPHLTAGERGVVMVIAVDRRQAQVILGYIRGLLSVPMSAGLVVNERKRLSTCETMSASKSTLAAIAQHPWPYSHRGSAG